MYFLHEVRFEPNFISSSGVCIRGILPPNPRKESLMTSKIAVPALLMLLVGIESACQPVSTFDISQQEDNIQVQGQAAMRDEDGTAGGSQTAELGAVHPEGIDFADPDPFIDYDTVQQEEGIEGDETD